jgi:REP element-mobilizing transposase RayT
VGQVHRIQSGEVLYHVCSRGVDKQLIFDVVDGDRAVFIKLLERTVARYGWRLHAYCLMGNHFHFVLDTPEANIAAGMQYLKSAYALWFNEEKPREGHLFERRYYAGVVDREAHFFATCRYVVLNPVRAGLCRHPADWRWSSYRATAGLVAPPPFLRTDFVHELFGQGPAAAKRYAQFVADALPDRTVHSGRALPQR